MIGALCAPGTVIPPAARSLATMTAGAVRGRNLDGGTSLPRAPWLGLSECDNNGRLHDASINGSFRIVHIL